MYVERERFKKEQNLENKFIQDKLERVVKRQNRGNVRVYCCGKGQEVGYEIEGLRQRGCREGFGW